MSIKIRIDSNRIYQRRMRLREVEKRLGRPPSLKDFIPDSDKRQEYLEAVVDRNKRAHLYDISNSE